MLNSILQKAHDGSTTDQWWFYHATSDYAAAPELYSDPPNQRNTKNPIHSSSNLPFVAQSVKDASQWLKDKPENTNLDSYLIGLLRQAGGEVRQGDFV